MNSFRRLHPGTPLEGRDGMFIIEDRKKWLWMGTSDGLFHYDKNDNFIPYNFVDGIPSSIFTLCPPVCDAEGNLWFGNSKGLVSLDVAHMNQKKHDFYPVKVLMCISMASRLLIRWSPLEVVFRESGWSLRRKMSLSVFPTFPILLLLLCPMNTSWRVGMTVG